MTIVETHRPRIPAAPPALPAPHFHAEPVPVPLDGMAHVSAESTYPQGARRRLRVLCPCWSCAVLGLHLAGYDESESPLSDLPLANVAATINGNAIVASAYTLTLSPSVLILPQLTASSGRAPASLPSYS